LKTSELKSFLGDKPIAVLYGGTSGEREVSLRSGAKVHASLTHQGFNAYLLDARDDFIGALRENPPAVVLIMLHGTPGEDGAIQGAVETLGLPYTGSGVQASAFGIHKVISKHIFLQLGLNTPPFLPVPLTSSLEKKREQAIETLGLPLVVKPVNEGSSLGVEFIRDADSLLPAMERERNEFGDFLLETLVEGVAVTVGILGTGAESFALPVLELRVKEREFYDYKAKYTEGMTEFVIPADIPDVSSNRLKEQSLIVHRALGCRGFSRVDGIVAEDGTPFLFEINTIPGMTALSDLPAEAEAMGISYDEVVLWILKSAWE
jgi:D-alanine-D-alanine ligase